MDLNPGLQKLARTAVVGTAAATLLGGTIFASTALAQERVRWQVPIAFPSHLVGLSTPIVHLSETVEAISAGNIQLRYYEPGELIPPFDILDAVSEGRYNAGFTWLGYDQGSIPVLPLLSGPPFGMEPPAFMAWHYFGGGDELLQEVYEPYGVNALLCGVIGPEAAGWFAEPLTDLDAIDGLRIRFAGIGGRVMERLGASVTMIPGGELYQAMERGTIDAMEFSAPAVDRILGMQEIVNNYHLPGWHQTYTTAHLLVNTEAWENLSDLSRVQIETGCRSATLFGFSESEWENPRALRDFEADGVNLQVIPDEILAQLEEVTMEVLDQLASEDEMFGRVLESQREWMQIHGNWHSKGHLPRSYYAPRED
ncbi:TRAP-type mannitol/chloroaromatic compound transport system substrate-binding protein [Natronocella acetinitrilica]|uniref:TRAP-type mannitol/chloroaromatic compound transport system substrate-binding protein n=1 Tax=Natronocella acetinitrilica TaxID=414046 RepID=A0AAE3KBP1_9GAMM|nr:TRAP transporter substrate-binding protein [Natronocella acetinitrilica]MCP1673833.1 TRAP-type mannitol/chloroaromatic compound transport system substrate-binding protein [Natronocella acetinitrilica]